MEPLGKAPGSSGAAGALGLREALPPIAQTKAFPAITCAL